MTNLTKIQEVYDDLPEEVRQYIHELEVLAERVSHLVNFGANGYMSLAKNLVELEKLSNNLRSFLAIDRAVK